MWTRRPWSWVPTRVPWKSSWQRWRGCKQTTWGTSQKWPRQPLPPKLQPPVAVIEAEARRMGQLLRVLLELARNDSGRLSLAMQQLDPEDLLLVAYERLLPLAPDRLQL